jgi:hypothetical protein
MTIRQPQAPAFRPWDRVQLKTTDEVQGTVTQTEPDGRFSVRFDGSRDPSGRRKPGGLYHYPWHCAEGFTITHGSR